MKISYSRVSTYLGCPYRHYLSYVEKLRLDRPKRPLMFGSDFHKLLEMKNDKKRLKETMKDIEDTYYGMSPNFQSEIGEDYLQDIKDIFNDYRRVYKGAPIPDITEHEFLIPIGKYKGEQVTFHGFVDEVYSEEGIIGEHKTFSQQPSMATLAMNTQICLYAKAWEIETGDRMNRVQWDYIKSKPASEPLWLEKSGRFSSAKSNQITPFSWSRACKRRGITDKDVIDSGKLYEQNISNFFFRHNIELVPSMIDTVWEDFMYVVKDMARRSETNKVKNINRDCSWCDYRPICYAEFTGGDRQYVIDTDYISKEER